MRHSRKLEILNNIRMITIVCIVSLGLLTIPFIVAEGVRNEVAAGAALNKLVATVALLTFFGLFITATLCWITVQVFSLFESTTLTQAIRLNEAMRMLHAKTYKESIAALKYHRINVFRAKAALGEDVEEDIRCTLISTFLTLWSFRSDRNAAFGSEYHCCDLEQIQRIIADNKAKWGGAPGESAAGTSVEVVALQRKIADLLEENKNTNQKYTAAIGRESKLKMRLAEVEKHMAILVAIAGKLSGKITKSAFRAKYLAIGKIYDITEVPVAYIEIFRKNMPKELINWGGAPKQCPDDEQS